MSDEKTITFPVEATHIMMFNRSIGDFSNDSMDGDFVAPPTFPQAVAQFDPDYSLRIKPGVDWFGSGKDSSGAGASWAGGHAFLLLLTRSPSPTSTRACGRGTSTSR